MAEQTCPNCGKAYQIGDEVCRYCGLVFPFSTVVIPAGSLLQGRYEIQELIHTGGMGYIYLAKDKKLYDRDVIIKQVRESIKDESHRKKLEEEASSMARLANPNIAMILDHFVEGGYYFLVVERIMGKTLGEVYKERGGRFSESEVLEWAITICEVVSYLHSKNVIHRDISPDNIMMMESGALKFIDFGTSHEFRFYGTAGTVGIGKYGYTPPEQWRGKPEQRSDIFAIGATIYYLLTGYLPLSKEYITGKSPQKEDFNPEYPPIRMKNPEISAGMESVLKKALQLDIDKRYASAAEFSKALRSLEKGKKKKPAVRRRIKVRLPKPGPVLKKKAVLFGIAAVIIIAGGGYWGISSLINASSTPITPTSPTTTQAVETTTPPPTTTLVETSPAQGSGNYCVKGYVYDASTGDPIEGAEINAVEVVPLSSGFNFYLNRSWEYSDSSGYYHIKAFSSNSTYILRVNASSYIEQWYENVNDREEATLLTFTPGETLNIDFLMTKSGSISGEISGKTSGTVDLDVLDPATGEAIADKSYQMTTVSYQYLVTDLPPGDYYVKISISSGTNIDIYYDNSLAIDTATLVHVTSGQETPNIDFDLSMGSISGRVVADADGQPIGNLHVYVSDYVTNAWIAGTYTNDDGTYTLTGLPEGSYRVRAVPSNMGQPYADEYYNNTYDHNMAQAVTVGFNQDVAGIDFSLAPEVSISGRVVTDADGQPIANVHLNVQEYFSNWWGPGTTTDSDGYYTIGSLPPGTYRIYASPGANNLPYANEWYDNTYDSSMAQQITIDIGQDATGINFSLAPGGHVSGQVTDAYNIKPLPNILVECYRMVEGRWEWLTNVWTDSEGKYSIYGIPYGQFFMRARGEHTSNTENYILEYYPEKETSAEAESLTLNADSNLVNINFTLEVGGSISGRIISETSFEAIAGVHIDVWDYVTGEWYAYAETGSDGTYTVHGVPPGSHRLYTNTSFRQLPFIGEYYDDTTDYSKAMPISVSVGHDTPNINFILTPTSLSKSKSLLGTLCKINKTSIIKKIISIAEFFREPVLIPKNLLYKNNLRS